MALNIDLFDTRGRFLELDASPYGIGYGSGLGAPEVNNIWSDPLGGVSRLVHYNHTKRVLELPITIQSSTSLDDWIDNYNNLAGLLRDAKDRRSEAYLAVQLNGMTNTTIFDVLGGEIPDAQYFDVPMKNTSAPHAAFRTVTLYLKPYGRNQSLTEDTSGTLNNFGGASSVSPAYIQTSPVGDRETPAKLIWQPSTTWRWVWIARRTRGNVSNFIPVLQCEEGTFTGYVVTDIDASGSIAYAPAAVANSVGGNVGRVTYTATATVTNNPLIEWEINDNLPDFYGRHRVLLRIDDAVNSADNTITTLKFRLRYGGDGTAYLTAKGEVDISGTDDLGSFPCVLDLGVIEITEPPDGAIMTSFKFELDITIQDATTVTIDLDCITLLPCDEFMAFAYLSAVSGSQDKLILDAMSAYPAFLLDTGDVAQPETFSAESLLPPPYVQPGTDNLWIAVFGEGAISGEQYLGSSEANTYTIKLQYFPLYDLARGA